MSTQLCCSVGRKIGNEIASASAFPNGVWERGNISFSSAASGTAPLLYQWRFDDENIIGQTNATLSITAGSSTAGAYSVVVQNSYGTATSNTVPLIVLSAEPPASQTANQGQPFSLTVTPVGPGPFTYQWLFNGSPISGATSPTYTISDPTVNSSGNYSVVVTDSAGSAVTAPSDLTFTPVLETQDTPAMPPAVLIVLGLILFSVSARLLSRQALST